MLEPEQNERKLFYSDFVKENKREVMLIYLARICFYVLGVLLTISCFTGVLTIRPILVLASVYLFFEVFISESLKYTIRVYSSFQERYILYSRVNALTAFSEFWKARIEHEDFKIKVEIWRRL